MREEADLGPAVALALDHGDGALMEEHVPGRETRVGVLDIGGRARGLPVLECHVTPDHPLRGRADDVDMDDTGRVTRCNRNMPGPATCGYGGSRSSSKRAASGPSPP